MLDVEATVKAIRARKLEVSGGEAGDGVWIVLDLVAFAPHRCIDVRKWDIDFAVFSFYKVCLSTQGSSEHEYITHVFQKLYGPHTAALYTRSAALSSIVSVAHHFHSPRYDSLPFKLQPGGPGYELSYGAAAVLPYLYTLSSPSTSAILTDSEEWLRTKSTSDIRIALEHTSALFETHERMLMEPLLAFLTSQRMYRRGVRIVGPETCESRAPTVSFIVIDGDNSTSKSMLSKDLVEQVDQLGTVRPPQNPPSYVIIFVVLYSVLICAYRLAFDGVTFMHIPLYPCYRTFPHTPRQVRARGVRMMV